MNKMLIQFILNNRNKGLKKQASFSCVRVIVLMTSEPAKKKLPSSTWLLAWRQMSNVRKGLLWLLLPKWTRRYVLKAPYIRKVINFV